LQPVIQGLKNTDHGHLFSLADQRRTTNQIRGLCMSILNSNTLTGILGSIRKPQRNTRSPDKQQPGHNLFEDAIAMLAGTMMVSFGVLFFKQSGLMTGGTAGLALLITKIIPVSFGTVFFLLNLPFYYLAIKRMGWGFTIKTFIAIGLVSFISNHQGMVIHVDKLQPLYACIFGNILLGVGFVILFRHKSSLGGINILALYIQEKTGFKDGGRYQHSVAVLEIHRFLSTFHLDCRHCDRQSDYCDESSQRPLLGLKTFRNKNV
jgi:hypothetical protein